MASLAMPPTPRVTLLAFLATLAVAAALVGGLYETEPTAPSLSIRPL